MFKLFIYTYSGPYAGGMMLVSARTKQEADQLVKDEGGNWDYSETLETIPQYPCVLAQDKYAE